MIAKLMERIFLARLQEECVNRRINPDTEFGFHVQHSTELQAFRLTEKILQKLKGESHL